MTRRRDSDLNGHKSWEFERSVSIKKKLVKSQSYNTESEFAQNMYVHLQVKSFGKYLGQNVSGSQYGQSQSE